jgi:AraC-like DNA-binding protein/mannose-6-phosphate isomerase-like protein (cupin superfamily)
MNATPRPLTPAQSRQRTHAPFDRYTVAFPEIGIPFLAEVEWNEWRNHRFHSHHEFQTLWILDGYMGLEIDGRRFDPPSGACYMIPATRIHNVYQRHEHPHCHFLDLRLSFEVDSPYSRFFGELHGQIVFHADAANLRSAAADLRAAIALNGPRRLARIQSVVWEMFFAMLSEAAAAPPEVASDPDSVRLRIADGLMRDHIAEPLDVAAIAAAARLSRSQLTRLYRKHMNAGPAERLRQLRVEKARELLRSSALTVKEIAHVCGFACPNHFCRVFLQIAGTTPTDYRDSKSRTYRQPRAGRRTG